MVHKHKISIVRKQKKKKLSGRIMRNSQFHTIEFKTNNFRIGSTNYATNKQANRHLLQDIYYYTTFIQIN